MTEAETMQERDEDMRVLRHAEGLAKAIRKKYGLPTPPRKDAPRRKRRIRREDYGEEVD